MQLRTATTLGALCLLACGGGPAPVSPDPPVPTSLAPTGPVLVSGTSPFPEGCDGPSPGGTFYPGAEVEPFVAVSPRDARRVVGVYQQDRWSNGGARGLRTAVSTDGGRTWTRNAARFSRCTGGGYERASDPWVTFSPDGTAWQSALAFDRSTARAAVLVSRSGDGGATWDEPASLASDDSREFFLDKESITADPADARFVYAAWDRLRGPTAEAPEGTAPAWFTRTTDGGRTWEPARVIYDPGDGAQTLGHQVAVLGDGTLLDMFVLFQNVGRPSGRDVVVVMRSLDRGVSWSDPIVISDLESVGVVDPKTGGGVRTGDVIPAIAVQPGTDLAYVVWQDARFSGGVRDGIVISRSADGGLSWSAPAPVNQAPTVQAFTPAVSVAPGGRLGVGYYDFRRDDPADPSRVLTQYWLATSTDGGTTWRETGLGGAFDLRGAPDVSGPFLGDYQGLAAVREGFFPMWVMANPGRPDDRTDVWSGFWPADVASLFLRPAPVAPAVPEQFNLRPLPLAVRARAHREIQR